MVAHTQRQDALVDAQARGIKHKVLKRERFLTFSVYTEHKGKYLFIPLTYFTLTGAFLSIGLMTNFLSLKEMLRISLQGKPIFGVNLKRKVKKWLTLQPLNILLTV